MVMRCACSLNSLCRGHGRHPLKTSINNLKHITPGVLRINARRALTHYGRLPNSAPAGARYPLNQRPGLRVRHTKMEEPAAVILKVDICLFETRIYELEDFETDAVPGGHVREFRFLQRIAVDGEYRRIRSLGALHVQDLAADELEPQYFCVPFDDGVDVVDRDGYVVDRASVGLQVLIIPADDNVESEGAYRGHCHFLDE